MDEELEMILTNLKDAGCGSGDLNKTRLLYEAGNTDALILHLRKCRCSLMEELHESQRKVDCLDYLIRQTEKQNKQRRI
ncbi:MAG: hypothetical protein K6D03_10040 [Solobacterium sp.]|nr:hypothetical protein [Solobacterium sp.]